MCIIFVHVARGNSFILKLYLSRNWQRCRPFQVLFCHVNEFLLSLKTIRSKLLDKNFLVIKYLQDTILVMFVYRKFTKRRFCVYVALLPFAVVYLIGFYSKGNYVEYTQKHLQLKTFGNSESHLKVESFFRKLRNNSYETCAAIFNDTSSVFKLSHKLDRNNRFDDPIAIPWSDEQEENALLFTTEILNILQGAPLQGNSGNFPDQQRFYFEIAQMKFVRTVCETGFNAGTFNFQITLIHYWYIRVFSK